MYKAYYDSDGNLTIIGRSDEPGNFIEIDEQTFLEVTKAPQKWQIIKNKLVPIEELADKPPRSYKFVNENGEWIVQKDNLFSCISYAKIKPSWFDDTKHSWIKYD